MLLKILTKKIYEDFFVQTVIKSFTRKNISYIRKDDGYHKRTLSMLPSSVVKPS